MSAARMRVAIVGAGFAGLGMAIRLKQAGMSSFVVLERSEDLGGTWRDNTYPGCACDIPSHLYSFSFAPNPLWTRTYAPQREIWAYLRRCAIQYGILPHIRWGHRVLDARWDAEESVWRISTTRGDLTAEILILGNGPLSEPALPAIPGLDTFAGATFHSAEWDHTHDLRGARVAVIGTGASAIQIVPQIQPQVGRLYLFQRTPPWIIPRGDRPISARRQLFFRALPLAQHLARSRIYWRLERDAIGFVFRPRLLADAERLVLRHLAAQVPDPALRARLTPTYRMGCKRILLSDDYYPALTRENVEVVGTGIRAVRAGSIVTEDGTERAVDTIICATGFHVTDNPLAWHIQGRAGRTLADAWRDGRQAHLGTTVAGFPNLFLLVGPNTGLGHNSMIYMIESQITYVLGCLHLMARRRLSAVEVRSQAQAAFNERLRRRMGSTVWLSGCASWYLDAHGRNSTLWPGFTWEFRLRTRRFDAASYTLTARRPS